MGGLQSEANVYGDKAGPFGGMGRTSNNSYIPLGGKNPMHTASCDNIVETINVANNNEQFRISPFDSQNNSQADMNQEEPNDVSQTMITLMPVPSEE